MTTIEFKTLKILIEPSVKKIVTQFRETVTFNFYTTITQVRVNFEPGICSTGTETGSRFWNRTLGTRLIEPNHKWVPGS